MSDIVEVLKRFLDDGRGEAYPLIQLSKAEIERLRNLNETYKHDAQNQRDIVEQQQARIAELEDDKAFWKNPPNGVWVEKDQIDAAWRVANCFSMETNAYAQEPLKELGIVRCEGCWDCADAGGPQDGVRCNGHGWLKDGINEIERLRARIAELEKPRMPDDTIGTEHYITDAQIDAAWMLVMDTGEDGRINSGAEQALRRCGIVRCEGCKGCGQVQVYTKDDDYDADGCERCGGHGWRKLTGAQKEFALRVEEDESESRW